MHKPAPHQFPQYVGLQPEPIEDRKIHCAICQKEFRRITPSHLKQHGLTTEQYRKQYGATSFLEQCREKVLALYTPNPFRVRIQRLGRYYELERNKDRIDASGETQKIHFSLSNLINAHLKAHRTISLFPANPFSSSFLIFDVDARKQSAELVHALHDVLREWFKDSQFHTYFSGHKGFHVLLPFTAPVNTNLLTSFGLYVKDALGLTPTDPKIEILPGSNNHPAKLPMAIHESTGLLCSWVEHESLTPLQNQFHYLLDIHPIDATLFRDVAEETLRREKFTHTKPRKPATITSSDCKRVFQCGLTETGTRHHWTFRLALWLRDVQKVPESEAYELLIEWGLTQLETGMSMSDSEEVLNDTHYTVRSVYRDNRRYTMGTINETVQLTHSEVGFLRSLKGKATQAVFLALLLQYKTYTHSNKSTFTASEFQLESLSGTTRKTVRKKIRDFVQQGWLEIVSKGRNSWTTPMATEYRVSISFTAAPAVYTIDVQRNRTCKEILAEGFSPL